MLKLDKVIYQLYEWVLWRQIKDGPLPSHIAIILDGNRRYARELGVPTHFGHKAGVNKVKEFLKWAWQLKIRVVTLYAFSTENFRRNKEEVEELMKIFEENLKALLIEKAIHENKVKIKILGRIDLLPKRVQGIIKKVEDLTKEYENFYLNVALAYGGRTEIVDAVKEIAKKVKLGEISIEEINESLMEQCLYTSHLPKPDPDLIIRTSGEERLSNFLLWQSAYSELFFIDTYWPEFRKVDFWRAIREFQRRKRRFGL